MDAAVATGLFTLIGVALGGIITAANQRSASHRADRAQAADLLARVTQAATNVETELAMYRQRRDSKRANGLALGQVLLELGAARAEGNWLRGAASGVSALRTWDLAEAATFHERFAAAASEMNPALVQLSLISPELQQAVTRVTKALTAVIKARKPGEIEAAGDELAVAVGGTRRAVEALIARRWWKRRRKPRHRSAAALERAPRGNAA
jgi:hypothetical protein